MALDKKISGFILLFIALAVLVSAVAGVFTNLDSAMEDLTDEGQCEDGASGYWNVTDEECQVSVSNNTALASETIPLGNMWTTDGIVMLTIFGMLVLLVIMYALKRNR